MTISVCYRTFLQIDWCSEIILATAKNKFRIICIEVTICPVCRLFIFRLSLSFTDFISSISKWLTAVPKFYNFFYWVVFKALYKLTLSFNIIPSNYRPKNDMFISPIKEVTKWIYLLGLRRPISYCKTKNIAHVFVFVKGIHFQC